MRKLTFDGRLLAIGGAFVFSAAVSLSAVAPQRALELEDMFRFRRVSDPQISPDGRQIAYVVTEVNKAQNSTDSDIWIVDAQGATPPRQLTHSPKADSHPRWSPDGKWIAFTSTRSGASQIYLLPASGGEPQALTSLSTDASDAIWSPDGKSIAFVSAVYSEFSSRPFKESDRLNREKQEACDNSKVKARLQDKLLYRHWNAWIDDKRQHLFVVGVAADGTVAVEPRDVTSGENDGVPTSNTFTVGDDFAFSPDGKELAFNAPPLPVREQAWSTNYDVWTVDLETGTRRNITENNPAADGYPRYSPDGRYLAYRAQTVAGFEADRWQLCLLDRTTGERRSLTAGWDRSVSSFAWAADGRSLFVEADEGGTEPIFSVTVATGVVTPLVTGGANTAVKVSTDGRWITFVHELLTQPPEIARFNFGETIAQPVTHANAALLASIAFTAPESVTVAGSGGTPIQMWIIKPPFFDAAKKYPLVFWVHGGPQSAWRNAWSTRWNPEVWAAQGYVIAMPNPRGSFGFGQQFTNEISHDWGGKVFEDLMACLSYMKQQSYVDSSRMAAAGASYGGYMMNWFEGHVSDFKCLVIHDGVFNFNTMYSTTDEIWFDEHEHGKPTDPDFEKFSPHRFTANWATPAFIIHNELDFRCPISEGMASFTTLQRKGIRSKLLMFPDEGHWVLKPQNSERWHREVFGWLSEYLSAR